MRTLVKIALLCVAVPAAADALYTLDDLATLDKQQAWPELEAHLLDIAPSARDPRWQGFVEHAAMGLLASSEADPDRAAAIASDLTVKYTALKKSAAFMKKRADVGLAALAKCTHRGCAQRFLDYADGDPGNTDFAFAAGKLVARASGSSRSAPQPADAMPFFHRALAGRKDAKECKDDAVGKAVVAALDLAVDDTRVADAVDVADKLCWDATKDAVVEAFVHAGTRFKVNSCGFLKAHNALSPLSAKQCQSAQSQGRNP